MSLATCLTVAALGAAATVAIGISGASAQRARLDATTSTCAALQANMQRVQAALVTTGPYLYAMYYANPSFCGISRRAVPTYVATRDQAQCFIGYTCAQSDH